MAEVESAGEGAPIAECENGDAADASAARGGASGARAARPTRAGRGIGLRLRVRGWAEGWTPERAFLALALGFGAAFAIATPPFDAPDERRHFGRTVLVSEGRIDVPGRAPGHGATLPASLLKLHPQRYDHRCKHRFDPAALLATPLDAGTRAPATAVTTPFPPIAYLPPALAVGLGRVAGLPAAALLYLARFATLLAWCGIVYAALRVAPRRRWALAALALAPMPTFLSASVTADALATGFAWLFFALVLRAAEGDGASLSLRQRAVLVGAVALACTVKPGYWGLAALLLAIPAARFRDPAERWRTLALAGVVALAPSLLWAAWVQSGQPVPLGAEADPRAQLHSMWIAPGWLGIVLVQTFLHEWIPWVAGFVGVLGKLDVPLPYSLYAAVPLGLVALALLDGRDPPLLAPRVRLALVGLFAASVLCIIALAYVGWNPIGSPIVADVHGRYFLPLAPLLLLAVPARRAPPAALGLYVTSACAGVLAVSLWLVVKRFYLV